MRKITIIGAGQSGLQLGIGLLQNGYEVTIVTNRTAEEIENGKVTSSQCMFDVALQHERDLKLNYWDDSCPWTEGIAFRIMGTPVKWAHRLDKPAQSVDQRVKFPAWMKTFEDQGGHLLIQEVSLKDLERMEKDCDLLMVASGKGEIGQMFERDTTRSIFDKPMRALALTYVNNMKPRGEFSAVEFNLIPEVGEFFSFPAITTTGSCDILVFEGLPGGPMDCWNDVDSPEQHLEVSKKILMEHVPNEGERVVDCELTDENGLVAGRFPPTVRLPIGRLPSGGLALGVADTVCLNDPITGQGSNNASKCAAAYLASICMHGDDTFDEKWMNQTFERYWNSAQWCTAWTNRLLQPPSEQMVQTLVACGEDEGLAQRFVNGFNNPIEYFPWFIEPNAVDHEKLWV